MKVFGLILCALGNEKLYGSNLHVPWSNFCNTVRYCCWLLSWEHAPPNYT